MVTRAPGTRQLSVVERHGLIRRFEDRPEADALTTVLDLSEEVDAEGDGGLVAAAFHPRFDRNGRLFVSYTAKGGTVTRSRVVRFASSDGGASFDPRTRRILVDFDQTDPGRIHLNGDMRFGPDGYLYVSFGDGGPQGDPHGNAQNPDTFLGKILRIDVDQGDPYAVPADNPLVEAGGRPEIFALGLRNPWRFSFDGDGALWVGNVGSSWEEIDRVPAGANLGWPMYEGKACAPQAMCDTAAVVSPVAEYPNEGGAAVIGGLVYRGKAIPALAGRYVYGDYMRGEVWSLDRDGRRELVARTGLRIVSFAEEASGELLIVDFASGRLFRLTAQAPSTETLADRLSATGCFLPHDPRQPAAGLIAYDVRLPFWSDGAAKRRFLALPDGQSAAIRGDGTIAFPVGSVLVKEFFLGDRPVETRLFMKYRDGQWTGASYVWDADGREARLAPDGDGLTLPFEGVDWTFPSRPSCLACHNGDRGLGLELGQLDLVRRQPETGRTANQLDTLLRIGVLEGPLPVRVPLPASGSSVERRARAYLHVNCAVCHTRNGPTPVDMDLRIGTSLADMRICGMRPTEGDLGIAGGRRLAPGAPERSLLSRRMHAVGKDHMPPVGPRLVDRDGTTLIDEWIRGISACR
jgi:uncharacterized repeat protein (TIGR03806 family)